MQTAREIASCVKNVKYYTEKVATLVKQQLELDWAKGELEEQVGKYSMPEGIRFASLACISSACDSIKLYCLNIETNSKTAESQDKIFGKEEETENGVSH